MNKKGIISLSIGALAVTSLGLFAAARYTNKTNYGVKANSIATVTLDGTNNVLDSSLITNGWTPETKTKKLFSSTGGCIDGDFNFASSAVIGDYGFGGDNGVVTFTRNTSNGWRPTMTFSCDTGFNSFEFHANSAIYLQLSINGSNYITKNDGAKSDITYDFTSTDFSGMKVTSVDIYLMIVDKEYGPTPDPVTINKIELTYDVDACLNK